MIFTRASGDGQVLGDNWCKAVPIGPSHSSLPESLPIHPKPDRAQLLADHHSLTDFSGSEGRSSHPSAVAVRTT